MTQRLLYEYCDVLIVGSGLAGIRAGISALGENSRLDVLMASAGEGPTGSSFTNVNNALGIMVCHDDREKEAFYETAIRIAAPGTIDPGLVRILAEESGPLFEDLLRSGLTFRRGDNGALARYPGCFMPERCQAYVFTDLGSAYDRMKHRFEGAGGRFAGGWVLVDLITDDTGRVSGALFHNGSDGSFRAVRSGALVMASGGTAGLFGRNLTGRHVTGWTHGPMGRIGVRFVNTGYFQFLWTDSRTGDHWPCVAVTSPGVTVVDSRGRPVDLPDSIRSVCRARTTHVPVFHGGADAVLDDFLLSCADNLGVLTLQVKGAPDVRPALYAHAANGGAIIDAGGATSVEGLFACGECAGGMHGANRVGGAMVLSTQVFGRRAGISAARFISERSGETNPVFENRVENCCRSLVRDDPEWVAGMERLRLMMNRMACPAPYPGIEELVEGIRLSSTEAMDWRLCNTLDSARIIFEKTT
jgi:L-aspartate oxidase